MTELDLHVDADSGIRHVVSHEERSGDPADVLRLPKNRSTGDLLSGARKSAEDGKLRVSFDAGSAIGDLAARSPIAEHEHGFGISGLRRIRQQPASRAPSHPSSPTTSYTLPPRSSSMTVESSTSRAFAVSGPSSPMLHFGEDLSRFPTESLHSFSFAHQSEGALHNRQSVLKRAIEFMRDRLGLGINHPGVMTAQAKVSGDVEVQSMVDLLLRANILGPDSQDSYNNRQLQGSMTGPADVERNVFENAFLSRSTSPVALRERLSVNQNSQQVGGNEISRPGSSQPEPSLASEASAPDPMEPESPSASPILETSRAPNVGMKRTYTDISLLNLQTRLVEALAKPYHAGDSAHESLTCPTPLSDFANALNTGMTTPSLVHGHNNRWVPAAQAVFTTETSSPWTILLANDLACLVFGVTKVEFKKLSILEVVREDRRAWLEERLRSPGSEATVKARQARSTSARTSPKSTTSVKMGGGVTAQLLSKPPWRQQRAQTDDWKTKTSRGASHHFANKSRGVLLCGDIVPIRKRNGATGAASLWVKEKRGGLIWVLEEIAEDIATLKLDEELRVIGSNGATRVIWGKSDVSPGIQIQRLIPQMPKRRGSSIPSRTGFSNNTVQYFTAKSDDSMTIPVSVTMEPDHETLRVSSFPHIAGIVVLSASNLEVMSSNSVFSAALFGEAEPSGQKIGELIPQFEKILTILTEEDSVNLVDGIVVPEHSFRRARALLALREGNEDAATIFLRPHGLVAHHRDGSEINVDVQMRVVRSERSTSNDAVIEEKSEDSDSEETSTSEIVYALWITYSRQLHSTLLPGGLATPNLTRPGTPHQPSPGQNSRSITPEPIEREEVKPETSPTTSLTQQIQEAASQPISDSPSKHIVSEPVPRVSTPKAKDVPKKKKKISDFVVLEDMGQGAYGQVKLARYAKANGNGNGKKVVLKYVTKRRILVDTWTRDRRLGTVPLEIHVLDYLRRDELRHPNIVEMTDFFEDDVNYYIEMVPHGLPGLDLFDYIEMRSTMDEAECRNIFLQVVDALHHLHTKALVVHRDIKDENIILDGEGKVKLIDFGSAAYIKNGPFDVFVGTIDYAAPEVLAGKSYRGKEQDIWALGILLYTLVYKENPFYSIDEILDHELRIPWIMSAANIELIKHMLDRDVDRRLTISQVRDAGWCREGGD